MCSAAKVSETYGRPQVLGITETDDVEADLLGVRSQVTNSSNRSANTTDPTRSSSAPMIENLLSTASKYCQ